MLRRLRALTRRQRALLAAGVGLGAAGVFYGGSALLESLRDEERTLALRALVQQREQEAQERETEQQCVWSRRDGGPGCCSAISFADPHSRHAQAPRPL